MVKTALAISLYLKCFFCSTYTPTLIASHPSSLSPSELIFFPSHKTLGVLSAELSLSSLQTHGSRMPCDLVPSRAQGSSIRAPCCSHTLPCPGLPQTSRSISTQKALITIWGKSWILTSHYRPTKNSR